jgi:glycosyltransferase involved in cell wall biosynthesis
MRHAATPDQSMTNDCFRIAMFSRFFPPEYSGTALQAICLAKALRSRGHHIEFVTQRWPGLGAEAEIEGFRVSRLQAGHGQKHRELRYWLNVLGWLRKRGKDFDLLHSHGAYYTDAIIGLLGPRFGLRTLAKASLAKNDLHGSDRGLYGRLHRFMLHRIDACIAISHDLEREFLEAGVAASNTYFLPNGVDAERFRPASVEERRELRKRLNLPADRSIALFVGVFDERKNIEWLIKQWHSHKAFGHPALLLSVGPQSRDDPDGSFKRSMVDLARSSPELLRVDDPSDNIADYYRAADLFVLPSIREGLPNALLEAMACGLPVIAANASGTRELVVEGKTGYLFDAKDPNSLQQALKSGLDTSASRLGVTARALVEQRYAISRVAKRYERLYASLLARDR